MKNYFKKFRGAGMRPPATSLKKNLPEMFWGWLGGFLGILAVASLHYFYFDRHDLVMLIGSFGASAVLIYGAPYSPLAQPRNLLGGHFFSALSGVTMGLLFSDPALAGAMAVATAIALMILTRTVHPPGGATALIAVIGGPKIHQLGYLYTLLPALSGASVMLVIALLVNNLPAKRIYPQHWL